MPVTSVPETVVLRDGFIVTLSALRLAWDLEERGCHVRVAPDGVGLLIGPKRLLTPDDDRAIREHHQELFTLTRYSEAVQ